jgi:hypothetical protein
MSEEQASEPEEKSKSEEKVVQEYLVQEISNIEETLQVEIQRADSETLDSALEKNNDTVQVTKEGGYWKL